MKQISISFCVACFTLIFFVLVHTGCKPERFDSLGTQATAAFTVSPVAGRMNTFALISSSQNAYAHQWDRGNGQGFRNGGVTDTAYYPLAGTYRVRMYAIGRGGADTATQTITVASDDPARFFTLLTGRNWRLDPAPGANALVVGTEANPSLYYRGGPLAPCQLTDVYTFGADLRLRYAANGSTQYGGNITPNFICGNDLSFNNVSYTYTLLPAGSAGIAAIQLAVPPPTAFIGSTDGPDNNYYRIMSISTSSMVIRAGRGLNNGTVYQYKFVPR